MLGIRIKQGDVGKKLQKHINKVMKNGDNRLLDKFFLLFFPDCELKVDGNKILKSRKLHTLTTYLGPLRTPMLFPQSWATHRLLGLFLGCLPVP